MFDARSELAHNQFGAFKEAFSTPESVDDEEAQEQREGRDHHTGHDVFKGLNGTRLKVPSKPFDQ